MSYKPLRNDNDGYAFRFCVRLDGTEVEIMSIDAHGVFRVRGQEVAIDEHEGVEVYHALRDFAILSIPPEEEDDGGEEGYQIFPN